MYITEDNLGAFFSDYIPVEGISSIKSKSGIATSDLEVLVTVNRFKYNEISIIITCGGGNIFVVVESRRPYYWACGVIGTLSKLCPTKYPTLQTQPTQEQSRVKAKKVSSGPAEWTEVARRGAKATHPPPQQSKQQQKPQKRLEPKKKQQQ